MSTTNCTCKTIDICSAFGNCKTNKKCVNLTLKIYHTLDPDNLVEVTTTARVVSGLTTPVILGLGTMREFNLPAQFPYYFNNKSLEELVADSFRVKNNDILNQGKKNLNQIGRSVV